MKTAVPDRVDWLGYAVVHLKIWVSLTGTTFVRAAGLESSCQRPCQCTAPNLAVEPTPYSLRSFLASAFGRGSPRAVVTVMNE